jgi:hypothetical protein
MMTIIAVVCVANMSVCFDQVLLMTIIAAVCVANMSVCFEMQQILLCENTIKHVKLKAVQLLTCFQEVSGYTECGKLTSFFIWHFIFKK